LNLTKRIESECQATMACLALSRISQRELKVKSLEVRKIMRFFGNLTKRIERRAGRDMKKACMCMNLTKRIERESGEA